MRRRFSMLRDGARRWIRVRWMLVRLSSSSNSSKEVIMRIRGRLRIRISTSTSRRGIRWYWVIREVVRRLWLLVDRRRLGVGKVGIIRIIV
jgi:hypothetical protein